MNRLVRLLAVVLITTSCGSNVVVADGAEDANSVSVDDVVLDVEAQTDEPAETVDVTGEVVPTGREALAKADGQAHVLWFWGAH